ncbi:hypothetical protein Q4555_10025 [Octadecabacter sp. 1_MG-2023]|uniref:hypothetical protein n=1 Tax=unclassified Octadecabacter TaxID=196158 RepID=UPI001C09A25C|nr:MULTISPECIES: hypothetical protein [unclassified Octadecabacter]MBU2992233.1 hypothetical protein [Octadecabacter sp. B2R22]MDO6735011.1 hypothetical protein [Octadecabacter sp. 1_MG-2023]
MTRHISDNQQTLDSSKRAAVQVQHQKQDISSAARRKLLEHDRETSGRRLAQYLKIERGREA